MGYGRRPRLRLHLTVRIFDVPLPRPAALRVTISGVLCPVPRPHTRPSLQVRKKKTVDMYPRFTRHRPFHLRPFVFFPPSHIRSDWAVRWPALNPSRVRLNRSIDQSISQWTEPTTTSVGPYFPDDTLPVHVSDLLSTENY